MKKILTLFVIVIAFFSCIHDDGNYDYTPLKDVEVPNIVKDSTYEFLYQSQIEITPNVITDYDDSELSYMWVMQRWQTEDTLSTEKVLSVLADFPQGTLTLYVKHIESDVRWDFNTNLKFPNPYDSGWAILSNTATATSFNFYSGLKDEYIPNLFSTINGENLPAGAKGLTYAARDYSWVVQYDNEGFAFSSRTMENQKNLSEYFLSMDFVNGDFKPGLYGGLENGVTSSQMRMISSGGDLFVAQRIQGPWGFSAPIEGDHYISDYFASLGSGEFVLFDDKNQSYKWLSARIGIRLEPDYPVLQDHPDPEFVLDFDPLDTKMDCVFMGNTGGAPWGKANITSILKDASGNYHLHKLYVDANGHKMTVMYTEILPAGLITDNSIIKAYKSDIYIATGNKIHLYNSVTKAYTQDYLVLDDTVLAMDFYVESYYNASDFGVVVKDGNNSKLIVYDYIDTSEVTLTQSIEGQVVGLTRMQK